MIRNFVRERSLLAFLAAVALLEAAVLATRPSRDIAPFLLILVPPLAALLVSALQAGPGGVRMLFGRITRWRAAPRWYLAALGVPLLGTLAIVALAVLTSAASRPFAGLNLAAAAVPAVVLLPAMLEEFGWRGFGVPAALAGGLPPLWATLAVGIVFALAHLPLYLPGQLYGGLPLWPLPLILISYSVLLAWIFVGSGESSFLAGLGHAALNGMTPMTWGVDPAWVWQARAVVFVAIAFVIVVVFRPSSWTREPGGSAIGAAVPPRPPRPGQPRGR
jgi:uncharacterized protein